LPLALGLLACVAVLLLPKFGLKPGQWSVGVMAGIPAVICYFFVDRPLRFALGLGAIIVAGFFYTGTQGKVIHIERNFFGVIRVTEDRNGEYRQLVHGTTIHGRQSLDPARAHEPLAYFHRTGPIGKVFSFFNPRYPNARIGVIGLGAGSLACYAQPSQHWTFYEIDPAVERIADAYFTFLQDCAAGRPQVILGDARLRLREANDGAYDLFIIDAFSSDVVPVHLLTREALQLYVSKLDPAGILCFHCSSRYLELKPVLANLAHDAGLVCFGREDLSVTPQENKEGKDPSQWVMMAWPGTDLDKLVRYSLWEPLPGQTGRRVWTDDYSNILEVFRWELPEPKD
jgi:predicted membrane-bound spermidine synthase